MIHIKPTVHRVRILMLVALMFGFTQSCAHNTSWSRGYSEDDIKDKRLELSHDGKVNNIFVFTPTSTVITTFFITTGIALGLAGEVLLGGGTGGAMMEFGLISGAALSTPIVSRDNVYYENSAEKYSKNIEEHLSKIFKEDHGAQIIIASNNQNKSIKQNMKSDIKGDYILVLDHATISIWHHLIKWKNYHLKYKINAKLFKKNKKSNSLIWKSQCIYNDKNSYTKKALIKNPSVIKASLSRASNFCKEKLANDLNKRQSLID